MKTIIIFMIVLLAFLQYKLWLAGDGIPETWHLQKQVTVQVTKNNLLRDRNKQLDVEVSDLKSGKQALEERARTELGMIKDDEVFYQLITPQGATKHG